MLSVMMMADRNMPSDVNMGMADTGVEAAGSTAPAGVPLQTDTAMPPPQPSSIASQPSAMPQTASGAVREHGAQLTMLRALPLLSAVFAPHVAPSAVILQSAWRIKCAFLQQLRP